MVMVGGGGIGREDGRYANRGSMEFWYKKGENGRFQNKTFVFSSFNMKKLQIEQNFRRLK